MHHNELTGSKKSYVIKIVFFMFLLVFSALMYIESHMLIDVLYCFLVLILFVKFLSMKLYQ